MDDASTFLKNHPIFAHSDDANGVLSVDALSQRSLGVSTSASYTSRLAGDAEGPFFGRRNTMVIRNHDLVVAVDSEIRMTSLVTDAEVPKSYTTLKTPEVNFKIEQVALNPSGKLLAVAGRRQLAVVVLPYSAYPRSNVTLNNSESKSLLVGAFHHRRSSSPRIVKIEWHPWGQAGTSLLVMTEDGKLREYDVSANPEDPVQTVSLVSKSRKNHSFAAEDPSSREVASFSLGKGKGDWAPFTVYALMRSGDVHSFCPFMPMNASIPSSTLFALEGYVSAKQQYLTAEQSSSASEPSRDVAAMYSKQRKYVSALLQQLPAEVSPDTVSRPVSIQAPSITKRPVALQGPFLLQPSPRLLSTMDVPDASDITYLTCGTPDTTAEDGGLERLGLVLIAQHDGRVDICLDLEKVEARWETSEERDLPMLAVYETVDLGLIQQASQTASTGIDDTELYAHPVFVTDQGREEVVYIYHAFGVHLLDLSNVIQTTTRALRDAVGDGDESRLSGDATGATVSALVSTALSDKTDPVIAASLSTDMFSASTMVVLTESMRTAFVSVSQNYASIVPGAGGSASTAGTGQVQPGLTVDSPGYVSLLGSTTYTPPRPLQTSYVQLASQIASPMTQKGQFTLTATTTRQLAETVDNFKRHMHEVQLAHRDVESRAALQRQELARQQETHSKLLALLKRQQERNDTSTRRLEAARGKQKDIFGKTDRILKAMLVRASPDLSENETRWFSELNRMRHEIMGADQYDERSLNSRADMLSREVERLLPRLKAVQTGESTRWTLLNKDDTLGTSQALHLTKRSQNELANIRRLEDQVVDLAAKMDVGLGKAPSGISASAFHVART